MGTPILTVYIPQYEKFSWRAAVIVDKNNSAEYLINILSSKREGTLIYFYELFHIENSGAESGGPSDFFQGPSFS